MLQRAARDGHTALPRSLALSVADAAAAGEAVLRSAAEQGLVVVDERWVALEELGTAEESVADEAGGLAAEERLAVVLGSVPDAAEAFVVGEVHRRPLVEVAAQLQSAPEDVPVIVAGDPDVQAAPESGSVLRALTAWGAVPVRDLRSEPAPDADALGRLPYAVAHGTLPEPDRADRSVAVVACADDGDVVRRAAQLVGDSVPRVFGVAPDEIVVVTLLHRGFAGAAALAEAVPGVRVVTLDEVAHGELPVAAAVIACLPGQAAGTLTRAAMVTLSRLPRVHLSVVTAAGEALPRVVAAGVQRPRWSRLSDLLT